MRTVKKISEVKGICHNLHFVRFLAAICVIISHSFAISEGSLENEWLVKITNNQITLGSFAVCMLFFFSGMMTVRSLLKGKTTKEFFWGRFVRIWPALITVVMLSVFVLGPMVTKYTWREYFGTAQTYKYFGNIILFLQHDLPGVFTNNIYLPTVNGSLWTLPVEVGCYVACFFAYKMTLLREKRFYLTVPIALVGLGSLFVLSELTGNDLIKSTILPLGMFYMGMFYEENKRKIKLTGKYALVSLAGCVLFGILGELWIGMLLCFPYFLCFMVFGLEKSVLVPWRLGELSYAMYLCGFPIQQMVTQLFGGKMNVIVNIIISIPIIIGVSAMIYILVEKPILNLKRK